MKQLDDKDVRERAFFLWEKAGRPDRKMDELWYEAERQLREERLAHELKAPSPIN